MHCNSTVLNIIMAVRVAKYCGS